MKTYYILFDTANSVSWRIRNTLNDLNTAEGLLQEIKDIETELGKEIILKYWKELNFKNGIRGFFQRLFYGVSGES